MTQPAAIVDVIFEERYWYPDDGGVVWLAGYHPVEAATGRYLARDAPELRARGLRVAARGRRGPPPRRALRTDAVAPGRPLDLRRDPDNQHDANAIAVARGGRGRAARLGPARAGGRGRARPRRRRAWSAVSCASSARRRATRAPG